MTVHPDDEFHPPTSADPYWTETCWFTFTVPERRISGQFYPFFQPNQGVTSGAVYFWDESGSQPSDCLYGKNFWHLPIPDQPLSDITVPNGIHYRCTQAQQRYEIEFDDPDGDDISARLTFEAVAPPNYLGTSHLDQPGRLTGTIQLYGEQIPVDSYGFRDRSWGPRSQFGVGLHGTPVLRGGYSYATASPRDGFHAITMDFSGGTDGDCYGIHGYLLRDGKWSKLRTAIREVIERDAEGMPLRVRIDGEDEIGRTWHAEGRTLNRFRVFLNPNLYTVNCLTEWTFDGITAYGEDHDNWSATGIRRFLRNRDPVN